MLTTLRIGLDAFVSTAAENAGEIVNHRRIIRRRLPHAAFVAVLGSEQKTLRPWVPGRAIDCGEVVADAIGGRQQGDGVRTICVKIDARNVALHVSGSVSLSRLVALKQKMCAVIVVRIGAVQALQDEVRVLVRFGFAGFHIVSGALHVA